jgi:hypothetical protein
MKWHIGPLLTWQCEDYKNYNFFLSHYYYVCSAWGGVVVKALRY